MKSFPHSIPDASASPDVFVGSEIRRQIASSQVTRRRVLKAIFATGMVVGISAIDLLPVGRKAYGDPDDPYSTWHECSDYNAVDTSSDNDWRWCNPDGSSEGHIDEAYCADNGYHRIDTTRYECGTGLVYTQDYRIAYRCTGDNGVDKNAWEWRRNGVEPEPRAVRCSDGKVFWSNECTGKEGNYNSTCKRWIGPA